MLGLMHMHMQMQFQRCRDSTLPLPFVVTGKPAFLSAANCRIIGLGEKQAGVYLLFAMVDTRQAGRDCYVA